MAAFYIGRGKDIRLEETNGTFPLCFLYEYFIFLCKNITTIRSKGAWFTIIILIDDIYYYHYPLSFINIFFIFAAEYQFQKISSSFTPGNFRKVNPRTKRFL